MERDAFVSPLRLREIILVLLVVAAGAAAVIVKVVTSHQGKATGSVEHRLKVGRGASQITFPPQTTLARAREIALGTFPGDARTIFYSEKAYCATEVVTSLTLARRAPPGIVGIEFLSKPKRADEFPLLDRKDVRRAIVVALDSTQGQPSC